MQHASPARAAARQNVAVLVIASLLPLLLMQCVSSTAPEVKTTAAVPARKPLRILALMTFDTMSHHIWMSALTVELAKRGHLVTSIDIHKHSENPPTLNTTVIETAFQFIDQEYMKLFMASTVPGQISMLQDMGEIDCKRDLASPTMQRLLDPAFKGAFDPIIIDYHADCMLGFVHRFNYPGVLAVSAFPVAPWVDDLMHNPQVPSILAHTLQPFPHPMNLWQRAWTLYLHAHQKFLVWWRRPVENSLIKRFFGDDAPSVEQLRQHVHVALVNENPVLEAPRPLLPSQIPVGGMHVKPADLGRIPSGLLKWMDDSKDGFIFVSFGSVMKGKSIDPVKKRALVNSFAALAPLRVLWKIEPDAVAAEPVTANVRVEAWAPQNDLFGHPNLRLFVSHCGGLSVQEASYHGVPVLGTPFVVDQFVNLEKVVGVGMGRRMPFKDITTERFVGEINEMLTNPRYLKAARHTRTLIHDQKETPLERAVWWAEYVGRHRGAPHLRSPARDLYWHQVMMLDIAALLALAVLAVLLVAFLVVKYTVYFVRKGSQQHKTPLKRAKKD
ncbi:UDP-glycosyltransferase UGT5-like isoform X1 [Frankliniella occidentalis]|uniref:UDP-glycosyltransferase UGT5-like isoform X1 n=1 Tax=Frankliniella occidentalis TaxID=133901 RepID=A0A6J1S6Q1_FRAOC|nr:UDP-glycosyltransferase UGT5-like isoform X1 [Frankliniella occidentalis]